MFRAFSRICTEHENAKREVQTVANELAQRLTATYLGCGIEGRPERTKQGSGIKIIMDDIPDNIDVKGPSTFKGYPVTYWAKPCDYP